MKNKLALSALFALAVFLTACGAQATATPAAQAPAATEAPAVAENPTQPSGYENPYGANPTAEPATATAPAATAGNASPATVNAVQNMELGSFLVDANGMTLYLLTSDPPGKSTCSGGCANNWPPLIVTDQPAAGDGLDASLLGTTTRADGSLQVTYNGHPLYLFKSDRNPGDVKGQGVGGVWFIVSPEGNAIK